MFQFITQHRVLLLVLLLVLIGLHLLSSGLRHRTELGFFGKTVLYVYTPVYKVFSWPFQKTSLTLSKYLFLLDLKEKSAALQEENNRFKGELARMGELEAENTRLAKLLLLKGRDIAPIAFAHVIGRSQNPEFRTILIDTGTTSGVKKSMAVFAPTGLVGFVSTAVPNAAKVVLLTDASARIDAILQRTRSRAVVYGRGQDLCTLEYLDSEVDVAVGDLVVTSGLGGVFPKGIQIGYVSSVNRGEFGNLQGTWIQPAVQFDSLEDVAIAPGGHGGAGLEQ